MVRVGLMLYGANPSEDLVGAVSLKPVMSLKTRIIHLKSVSALSPISYGRTYFVQKDSLIGTLAVGYGDGYTFRNSNRGEVLIPLANALLNASAGRPADAVADVARAVESFLARLATRQGVNLTGANGISQKLDKFRSGNHLPKKVVEAAKYLAHIRNAADHGVDIDPDVGSVWQI